MGKDEDHTPEETARRRDEVIRRMANTPPQPRVKSPPLEKQKPAASGPEPRKRDAAKIE